MIVSVPSVHTARSVPVIDDVLYVTIGIDVVRIFGFDTVFVPEASVTVPTSIKPCLRARTESLSIGCAICARVAFSRGVVACGDAGDGAC